MYRFHSWVLCVLVNEGNVLLTTINSINCAAVSHHKLLSIRHMNIQVESVTNQIKLNVDTKPSQPWNEIPSAVLEILLRLLSHILGYLGCSFTKHCMHTTGISPFNTNCYFTKHLQWERERGRELFLPVLHTFQSHLTVQPFVFIATGVSLKAKLFLV